MYICGNPFCMREVTRDMLNTLPGVKCPHCGYRILYKKRPPILKPIKAR